MVCHWHGLLISSSDIRKVTGFPFGAVPLPDLQKAAEALGFSTESVLQGPDAFRIGSDFPCIVQIGPEHLVVLSGASRGMVDVEDPCIGRYRLSFQVFADKWLQNIPRQTLKILNPSGSSDLGKGFVKDTEKRSPEHPVWTPRLLWTAALLWLTIILWLRWVELLFSAVAVRLPIQAFVPVVLLTALLGLAAYFLWHRWHLEVNERLKLVQILPRGMEGLRSSIQVAVGYALDKVVEKRVRYGWNALLAGPCLLVLSAFMAFRSVTFASILAGATFLVLWYYLSNSREWLGMQLQALLGDGSGKGLWALGMFPQGMAVMAFSGATVVWSLHCWMDGFAPETFLSGFLALVLWSLCLGLTSAGIRSKGMIWWGNGIIEQEAGEYDRLVGDIRLQLSSVSQGLKDIKIPFGKTTLMLVDEQQRADHLMGMLSARESASGMILDVGGIHIGSREREAFRREVAEFSSGGKLRLPFREGFQRNEGSTWKEDPAWQEVQLVAGASWLEGLQSLMESGATYLFLHSALPALDPFRQLVLIEQIVAQKGNATLVLATNRTEAAATADWVIFVRQGHVLGQGTPADVLGRFGEDAPSG